MCTRVTVVSWFVCLFLCLSVCLFVLTLVLAYNVPATNCTYQSDHCQTPKVFNWRISLKNFLSRVIVCFSFGIAKWSAILHLSFIRHRCGCGLECSMQCACAYMLPDCLCQGCGLPQSRQPCACTSARLLSYPSISMELTESESSLFDTFPSCRWSRLRGVDLAYSCTCLWSLLL